MPDDKRRFTILIALEVARKVAKENGFGHFNVVALQKWAHYNYENRWRAGFVRECDTGEHDLEYRIVFLDLDNDVTTIQHGFDLPFPRRAGKDSGNYHAPWPSRFEVSIDDAIQIAACATSKGCVEPRELVDINGIWFEHEMYGRIDQWNVVFHYEWKEGEMAGYSDACVFLIDIHTGDRYLCPIGFPGV